MNSFCYKCKKELPEKAFCKIKGRISRVCLACDRTIHNDRKRKEIETTVYKIYNGRCVKCDGVENLEIIPVMKTALPNPKAMILLCTICKREGIPTMTRYVRDCIRCGHRWIARKNETVTCSKCKSPYWNKAARRVR